MQEVLTITQVVQVNNNGYVFIMPYGAPFADIYLALEQLQADNKAKEQQLKEAAEKRKLEEEMKGAEAEASN
jgi:hypothetical protein